MKSRTDSDAIVDLAVVGAGPAGLSAAITAARSGLHPVVIDEHPRPGGQIFRQPPKDFARKGPDTMVAWGRSLLATAADDSAITWLQNTTAWGVFGSISSLDGYSPLFCPPTADGDGRLLALAIRDDTGTRPLFTRSLIIATGAYDLPVAFPGWTLPGIMTAGGVQSLIKSQSLLPARRYVLAGSHPLLLTVADQLLNAGAQIAQIAIARPTPSTGELLRSVGAVPGHINLIRGSIGAARRLCKAGVPISFSTIVSSAAGTASLERVELSRVDSQWRVAPGSGRTLHCDSLILGYGFLPRTELARQAGCTARWSPLEGGWIIDHDGAFRTNIPGIYVAGEPTGICGAEQSVAEGKLAALSAVRDLRPQDTAALRPLARRAEHDLRRARRFSAVVQRLFRPHSDALAGLATDRTLICRCEDVTAGAIRSYLHDNPHATTSNAIKLACRTGMGSCQGRYCEHNVSALVSIQRQNSRDEIGTFTARPPIKPLSLAELASLKLTKDLPETPKAPLPLQQPHQRRPESACEGPGHSLP